MRFLSLKLCNTRITRINQIVGRLLGCSFYKNITYICCLYAKKNRIQLNQSIKLIRITENISVWEKYWGQALFKRPNLRPGQLLKPGLKFVWGQLWGKNWGQPNFEARPGFISMPFWARFPLFFNSHILVQCVCRKELYKY